MSDHIRTERDGTVLRLIIDRPAKKNALTVAMYEAMTAVLTDAAGDATVRVVLVHGADEDGGASIFTAGNDLADFMMNPPRGEDSAVFRFLRAATTFPKPLVAAVAGPAIGIGTTLLLHCDLVYAAPSARFQMPFVNLGLCPEAASSLLVPRLVGPQKAAEWLLLGEPFYAEEAYRCGLVNEVVHEPDLLTVALKRCEALASRPPAAVRLSKQLLRQPDADAIQATIRTEGAHFIERLTSPETAEALTAFMERRSPDFSTFE
ncbi:MAG: enoyl-CoA hydratase [Bacteroidota bacterium]